MNIWSARLENIWGDIRIFMCVIFESVFENSNSFSFVLKLQVRYQKYIFDFDASH
jgi:hypothetical protein